MITKLEKNIVNSFNLAKKDLTKLQLQVAELIKINQIFSRHIEQLKKSETRMFEKIVQLENKIIPGSQVKTASTKTEFWASKTGKSFHDPHCPFAHNINPNKKIIFNTKDEALKKNFKPCNCIKK